MIKLSGLMKKPLESSNILSRRYEDEIWIQTSLFENVLVSDGMLGVCPVRS
jgi:hypothetical protein